MPKFWNQIGFQEKLTNGKIDLRNTPRQRPEEIQKLDGITRVEREREKKLRYTKKGIRRKLSYCEIDFYARASLDTRHSKVLCMCARQLESGETKRLSRRHYFEIRAHYFFSFAIYIAAPDDVSLSLTREISSFRRSVRRQKPLEKIWNKRSQGCAATAGESCQVRFMIFASLNFRNQLLRLIQVYTCAFYRFDWGRYIAHCIISLVFHSNIFLILKKWFLENAAIARKIYSLENMKLTSELRVNILYTRYVNSLRAISLQLARQRASRRIDALARGALDI